MHLLGFILNFIYVNSIWDHSFDSNKSSSFTSSINPTSTSTLTGNFIIFREVEKLGLLVIDVQTKHQGQKQQLVVLPMLCWLE